MCCEFCDKGVKDFFLCQLVYHHFNVPAVTADQVVLYALQPLVELKYIDYITLIAIHASLDVFIIPAVTV